jgi:hypothetical protein
MPVPIEALLVVLGAAIWLIIMFWWYLVLYASGHKFRHRKHLREGTGQTTTNSVG